MRKEYHIAIIAAVAALAMLGAAVFPGCSGREKPPLVTLQTGRTADELTRPPTLRHSPIEAMEGETAETPAAKPGETPAPEETPGVQAQAPEETPEPGAEEGAEAEAGDEAEPERDLIKEAGFDMIYPNFNRKTGRRDPFVPVNVDEADWEALKRMAGEKFRVIGTAMTPTGQIAMITVMEQVKIVREGDILENGSVVKSISPYEVVLDREGRELRLTMFTRKRVARMESEAEGLQIKNLDNINDMYKKYLEQKFGEEYEGREGEADRPDSFSDYLDRLETSSPGSDSGSKSRSKSSGTKDITNR